MSNDNKTLVWLVIVVMVLSFFGLWGAWSNKGVDKDEVKSIIALEIAKIPEPVIPEVPTAEEIAALVVVPKPGEMDNERIEDLWEDLYATEISALEDAAKIDAKAELEDDDWEIIEEYLELIIVDFYVLKHVDYEDTEITVLNLGLGEDEDKVVEIVFELEVKYTLREGPITKYRKIVLATANVVYEEGDLDEEEIAITFS